jgi:hypothetical protein
MRLSVNFTVNGIRWHAPAATIAGFALTTLTESSLAAITRAIAHLREVLGDQKYESLARAGQAMTTAAMATYAFDQIEQARAKLERKADAE